MTFRRIPLLPLLSGLFLIALCVAPASAADDKTIPPFDVPGIERGRVWLQWIFAFMFVMLALVVGFKNPRRGHLD